MFQELARDRQPGFAVRLRGDGDVGQNTACSICESSVDCLLLELQQLFVDQVDAFVLG